MWFNPFIHTRLRRRLGALNHLSALAGQNMSTVRRITLLLWTIQQDPFIPKWYVCTVVR